MSSVFVHYSDDRKRADYISPLSVNFIFTAKFIEGNLYSARQHCGFSLSLFCLQRIVSKRFIRIATVSSGLVLVTDFLTVGFIGHTSYILHSVLAVSTLVYITYIFTIAAIRKMEGSLYLTIASISMSAFVILTTISA